MTTFCLVSVATSTERASATTSVFLSGTKLVALFFIEVEALHPSEDQKGQRDNGPDLHLVYFVKVYEQSELKTELDAIGNFSR